MCQSTVGIVNIEKPVKDRDEICGRISIANNPVDIFFSSTVPLCPSLEAYCAIALLGAMKTEAELLAIHGELCSVFYNNLAVVQDIYNKWDGRYRKTTIKPSNVSIKNKEGARVGTFFSGGVDSFYTLLKNKEDITDLILVRGFDIPYHKKGDALYDKTSKSIHKIAKAYGVGVVEITTNIRQALDPYADWGVFGHGVALAACANVLSNDFQKIYIPGSCSYEQLAIWGTHPLLDPLWGSSFLKIVHDGCEASRLDKIRAIVCCEYALNHLRVCWENLNDGYNCGECEKCLRTMASLQCYNALEKCSVFPNEIDCKKVSNIRIPDDYKVYIIEIIESLEKKPGNEKLCASLEKTLRNSLLSQMIQPLKKPVGESMKRIPMAHKVLENLCNTLKI